MKIIFEDIEIINIEITVKITIKNLKKLNIYFIINLN